MIEVLPSKMGISVGRTDLEDSILLKKKKKKKLIIESVHQQGSVMIANLNLEQRDIKGSSSQVVDGDGLVASLLQSDF